MKKLGTLIILLVFSVIGIQTTTMAATGGIDGNLDPNFAVGQRKAIAAIYLAMRENKNKWLDADISKVNKDNWGWEDFDEDETDLINRFKNVANGGDMVWSTGGLCFGHMTEPANGNAMRRIDTIIDIDVNSRAELQYLAWHIAKATEEDQHGSYQTKSGGKAGILSWLQERGYKYGVKRTQEDSRGDSTNWLHFKNGEAYNGRQSIEDYIAMIKKPLQISKVGNREPTVTTIEDEKIEAEGYDNTQTIVGPYNIDVKGGKLHKQDEKEPSYIEFWDGTKREINNCIIQENKKWKKVAFNKIDDYNGKIYFAITKSEGKDKVVKEVVVKKTLEYIKARMVVSSPTQGNGNQNVAVFYGRWSEKTINAKVKNTKPDNKIIKIKKVDPELVNGDTGNYRTLKNASFVLGKIDVDGNGKPHDPYDPSHVSYLTSFEDNGNGWTKANKKNALDEAIQFTSGEWIEDLEAGYYKFYEVDRQNKYYAYCGTDKNIEDGMHGRGGCLTNEYYIEDTDDEGNPIQIKTYHPINVTTKIIDDDGNVDDNGLTKGIIHIKEGDRIVKVQLENTQQFMFANIKKVDADNTSKELENARFILAYNPNDLRDENGKIGIEYLLKDPETEYIVSKARRTS